MLFALSLAALSAPALDADWKAPFERADLLFSAERRPDFDTLVPMENCTGCEWVNGTCTREHDTNCSALWWPGLGNGFLGGIAQSPTLRIAGFFSGDYGRYTAGKTIPPIASDGFSNKQLAYRASIPAFASSIVITGTTLRKATARAALNLRDAVYYERTALEGGGEVQIRQYMHQTRRNLIVVDVTLDCTNCTHDAELAMRAASTGQQQLSDVSFTEQAAGSRARAGRSAPRQLLGVLRAPEVNAPPIPADEYDTNHTLGYVHDMCPGRLAASAGSVTNVQLLSVLTLSSESHPARGPVASMAKAKAKTEVVARAMQLYREAKATDAQTLLDEHRRGWAALWESGGIELETDDLELQQTTNSTLYYLLMSTRPDWLFSTLVPSTIAASAPYPHGYYGTTFWDQDTFQAPPLMVLWPTLAENMLRNRLFQLPAYKINAAAFGLRGAYVPWETAFTGGFARDNRINHIEVHVTADVALFVKQYYQLTRNATTLRELFPLLEAVSDFVVSRVNRTDEQGWMSVETVEGSDEIPKDVNNDVFTNAVSVQALETTVAAAAALRVPVAPVKLGAWRRAAARIKIGAFNGTTLHREYDQYQMGAEIGQGDTVLLGFPLQFNDSHRVWRGNKSQMRLSDIRYYGDRVDPDGSYMTAGHYVIAWLERPHRDLTNASLWFARGRAKNYAPWRIWSEHDKNDGGAVNFITAGGMFLQSLLFGYAGLRFHDEGISLDPVLPPNVSAMKIRGLNFAAAEFDVSVDAAGTRFSRRSRPRHTHDGAPGEDEEVRVHSSPSGVHWLTLASA